MSTSVPPLLLIDFFHDATKALNKCDLEEGDENRFHFLSEHRKTVLQVQSTCLARVVSKYTEDVTIVQVQEALKELGSKDSIDTSIKEVMDTMNDAARLAFCRLVLHEECRWDATDSPPPRDLNSGGTPMERSHIVEYAGLCNGVVRLPNIQKHLQDGSKLFDDLNDESAQPLSAPKRLERIQHQLLRAIGFDVEFGKKEIQRYYTLDGNSDPALVQILHQLSSNMTVAITNATMLGPTLSDQDEGGVTRVVSVNYSEKVLSPDGQSVTTLGAPPPTQEHMVEQTEQRKMAQLQMAKQTAALEQAILKELSDLSEEEDRRAELSRAKKAHEDFMRGAMEIPAGPERIAYLTSMDAGTQRLLLMYKLSSSALRGNKGE